MKKLATLLVLVGCTATEEAATVSLPVATSAAAMESAATDLGYQVQVSQIRIAVSTMQFTVDGETHAEDSAYSVTALPHPGHSAGGEVTGELPGNFVLVWNGQMMPALGDATLLAGNYHGANFQFRAADAADQLPADDGLLGHAFHIIGTATKDGTTKPFEARLDVEPDTAIVGAVFDAVITESSTDTLALAFHPTDPYGIGTVFDAIDFFLLPESAGTLSITPGSTAHNILRRTLQTHDHYTVVTR
jgi:hypothetical protein